MNRKISPHIARQVDGTQWQTTRRKSLGYTAVSSFIFGMLWSLTGNTAAHAQHLKVTSLTSENSSEQTIYASLFLIEALAQLNSDRTATSNIELPSQINNQSSLGTFSSSFPVSEAVSTSISSPISSILDRGQEISINGEKFSVAWFQWQQGTSVRTGISDIGAMQTLGIELLSTNNLALQPVQWFSSDQTKPTILNAHWLSPYRYLDVTDLALIAGWQFQVSEGVLTINSSKAKIERIREENRAGKKQIVLELDRPTFWQLSQTKKESVITLEGITPLAKQEEFQASILPQKEQKAQEEEGDSEEGTSSSILEFAPSLFSLAKSGTTTKLLVNHPAGNGLRVVSLANPNRLVIDIRPDALAERDILWAPGINWRQKFVELNAFDPLLAKKFPVVWLEIDRASSDFYLKPFTSNSNDSEGTSPLTSAARSQQAIAAINGGFFNRNNQLPLGAIRQYGRWLSGPILNRGAIAWDYLGHFQIGHLSLKESLIASTGKRLPVVSLNSGYVQRGIARYTREWGETYTPLIDNEMIVVVKNDRVIQQLPGGMAKEHPFSVPESGYLLTIRGDKAATNLLAVGTQVSLESGTNPSQFGSYPHILGAGPVLLHNGEIVLDAEAEKFSIAFNRQAAIRSAIATTNRGTLIIGTVHESSKGMGATLKELAEIMQHLGAVDALNLDGGSSTSLYLGGQLINRSPATAARVHNGIGIFVKN